MTNPKMIDEFIVATPPEYFVDVCGVVVEPDKIRSPALRQLVSSMARQDEVTLASCRHKDWSQQGQCGCIMGCLGI